MKKQNEKVKEHYDRVQPIYNFFWMNKKNLGMHYGFWEEGIKNLHEAILNENKVIADRLEIRKDDIVLDAGCGVGGTTIWLAKNYGVNVTGITLSEKQAESAINYAKGEKVDHLVKFYVRDFCDTGFTTGSFTKIFSIESVCHAENKEDFINEAFRILKTGGKLVVADFFVEENLDEKRRNLVNEWCRGWEMPNLSTLVDFSKKLETAGFKNIEYLDKTKEVEPSSKRMYIIIGRFIRLIFKILELFKLHQSYGGTKAVVSQYYAFKEGAVRYYLFSAQKT